MSIHPWDSMKGNVHGDGIATLASQRDLSHVPGWKTWTSRKKALFLDGKEEPLVWLRNEFHITPTAGFLHCENFILRSSKLARRGP
jgi:hypothetical protein